MADDRLQMDTPPKKDSYHITVQITKKSRAQIEAEAEARRLQREADKAEKEATRAARAAEKEAERAERGPGKTDALLGNLKYLGGKLLMKMAVGGASLLRSKADEVNRLNVFPVPDGDTGDNMRMTIEAGIAAIENLESDDLGEVMKVLSHGMLLGARGNSGVILSQFFAGTARGFSGEEKADPVTIGHALELGVQKAYGAVMTPTEGTILTVAREAVEYAVSQINEESTVRTLFADLVKEMHASLDRTPEILTVLKEAGVVDSGGAGLLYIMDGFNRVLNGEDFGESLTERVARAEGAAAKPTVFAFTADSEMVFGYCTELLVQITKKKADPDAFDIEPLKAFLSEIGDSIVVFKTDGIVKIHVHTFTPDKVLAYCLGFGEFLTVKIENMSVQHTALSETDAAAVAAPEAAPLTEASPVVPTKKYGAVAVASGDGIAALFAELGTDAVVSGGQTQNPSTEDFLQAFRTVPAEHIFVFPNNGNILMAARQAADLYEDATVHVVPAKSIGAGYVALSQADFSAETPKAVLATMKEAMSHATAGYVSPSVRDAKIGKVVIKKGDTIGVIDKTIVLSKETLADAAAETAKALLSLPEKFMLTVFVGKDATEADATALRAAVSAAHPTAEVYFIDGGQDVYPFLFVAE